MSSGSFYSPKGHRTPRTGQGTAASGTTSRSPPSVYGAEHNSASPATQGLNTSSSAQNTSSASAPSGGGAMPSLGAIQALERRCLQMVSLAEKEAARHNASLADRVVELQQLCEEKDKAMEALIGTTTATPLANSGSGGGSGPTAALPPNTLFGAMQQCERALADTKHRLDDATTTFLSTHEDVCARLAMLHQQRTEYEGHLLVETNASLERYTQFTRFTRERQLEESFAQMLLLVGRQHAVHVREQRERRAMRRQIRAEERRSLLLMSAREAGPDGQPLKHDNDTVHGESRDVLNDSTASSASTSSGAAHDDDDNEQRRRRRRQHRSVDLEYPPGPSKAALADLLGTQRAIREPDALDAVLDDLQAMVETGDPPLTFRRFCDLLDNTNTQPNYSDEERGHDDHRTATASRASGQAPATPRRAGTTTPTRSGRGGGGGGGCILSPLSRSVVRIHEEDHDDREDVGANDHNTRAAVPQTTRASVAVVLFPHSNTTSATPQAGQAGGLGPHARRRAQLSALVLLALLRDRTFSHRTLSLGAWTVRPVAATPTTAAGGGQCDDDPPTTILVPNPQFSRLLEGVVCSGATYADATTASNAAATAHQRWSALPVLMYLCGASDLLQRFASDVQEVVATERKDLRVLQQRSLLRPERVWLRQRARDLCRQEVPPLAIEHQAAGNALLGAIADEAATRTAALTKRFDATTTDQHGAMIAALRSSVLEPAVLATVDAVVDGLFLSPQQFVARVEALVSQPARAWWALSWRQCMTTATLQLFDPFASALTATTFSDANHRVMMGVIRSVQASVAAELASFDAWLAEHHGKTPLETACHRGGLSMRAALAATGPSGGGGASSSGGGSSPFSSNDDAHRLPLTKQHATQLLNAKCQQLTALLHRGLHHVWTTFTALETQQQQPPIPFPTSEDKTARRGSGQAGSSAVAAAVRLQATSPLVSILIAIATANASSSTRSNKGTSNPQHHPQTHATSDEAPDAVIEALQAARHLRRSAFGAEGVVDNSSIAGHGQDEDQGDFGAATDEWAALENILDITQPTRSSAFPTVAASSAATAARTAAATTDSTNAKSPRRVSGSPKSNPASESNNNNNNNNNRTNSGLTTGGLSATAWMRELPSDMSTGPSLDVIVHGCQQFARSEGEDRRFRACSWRLIAATVEAFSAGCTSTSPSTRSANRNSGAARSDPCGVEMAALGTLADRWRRMLCATGQNSDSLRVVSKAFPFLSNAMSKKKRSEHGRGEEQDAAQAAADVQVLAQAMRSPASLVRATELFLHRHRPAATTTTTTTTGAEASPRADEGGREGDRQQTQSDYALHALSYASPPRHRQPQQHQQQGDNTSFSHSPSSPVHGRGQRPADAAGSHRLLAVTAEDVGAVVSWHNVCEIANVVTVSSTLQYVAHPPQAPPISSSSSSLTTPSAVPTAPTTGAAPVITPIMVESILTSADAALVAGPHDGAGGDAALVFDKEASVGAMRIGGSTARIEGPEATGQWHTLRYPTLPPGVAARVASTNKEEGNGCGAMHVAFDANDRRLVVPVVRTPLVHEGSGLGRLIQLQESRLLGSALAGHDITSATTTSTLNATTPAGRAHGMQSLPATVLYVNSVLAPPPMNLRLAASLQQAQAMPDRVIAGVLMKALSDYSALAAQFASMLAALEWRIRDRYLFEDMASSDSSNCGEVDEREEDFAEEEEEVDSRSVSSEPSSTGDDADERSPLEISSLRATPPLVAADTAPQGGGSFRLSTPLAKAHSSGALLSFKKKGGVLSERRSEEDSPLSRSAQSRPNEGELVSNLSFSVKPVVSIDASATDGGAARAPPHERPRAHTIDPSLTLTLSHHSSTLASVPSTNALQTSPKAAEAEKKKRKKAEKVRPPKRAGMSSAGGQLQQQGNESLSRRAAKDDPHRRKRLLRKVFGSKRVLAPIKVTHFTLSSLRSEAARISAQRRLLEHQLQESKDALAAARLASAQTEAALTNTISSLRQEVNRLRDDHSELQQELVSMVDHQKHREQLVASVEATQQRIVTSEYTVNAATFGEAWQEHVLRIHEQTQAEVIASSERLMAEYRAAVADNQHSAERTEQRCEQRLQTLVSAFGDDQRNQFDAARRRLDVEKQHYYDDLQEAVAAERDVARQRIEASERAHQEAYAQRVAALELQYADRVRSLTCRQEESENIFQNKMRQVRNEGREREMKLQKALDERVTALTTEFEEEVRRLKTALEDDRTRMEHEALTQKADYERRCHAHYMAIRDEYAGRERASWALMIEQGEAQQTVFFAARWDLLRASAGMLHDAQDVVRREIARKYEEEVVNKYDALLAEQQEAFDHEMATLTNIHSSQLHESDRDHADHLQRLRELQDEQDRCNIDLHATRDHAFWQQCQQALTHAEQYIADSKRELDISYQDRYMAIITSCQEYLERDIAAAREAFESELATRQAMLSNYLRVHHLIEMHQQHIMWQELRGRCFIQREHAALLSSMALQQRTERETIQLLTQNLLHAATLDKSQWGALELVMSEDSSSSSSHASSSSDGGSDVDGGGDDSDNSLGHTPQRFGSGDVLLGSPATPQSGRRHSLLQKSSPPASLLDSPARHKSRRELGEGRRRKGKGKGRSRRQKKKRVIFGRIAMENFTSDDSTTFNLPNSDSHVLQRAPHHHLMSRSSELSAKVANLFVPRSEMIAMRAQYEQRLDVSNQRQNQLSRDFLASIHTAATATKADMSRNHDFATRRVDSIGQFMVEKFQLVAASGAFAIERRLDDLAGVARNQLSHFVNAGERNDLLLKLSEMARRLDASSSSVGVSGGGGGSTVGRGKAKPLTRARSTSPVNRALSPLSGPSSRWLDTSTSRQGRTPPSRIVSTPTKSALKTSKNTNQNASPLPTTGSGTGISPKAGNGNGPTAAAEESVSSLRRQLDDERGRRQYRRTITELLGVLFAPNADPEAAIEAAEGIIFFDADAVSAEGTPTTSRNATTTGTDRGGSDGRKQQGGHDVAATTGGGVPSPFGMDRMRANTKALDDLLAANIDKPFAGDTTMPEGLRQTGAANKSTNAATAQKLTRAVVPTSNAGAVMIGYYLSIKELLSRVFREFAAALAAQSRATERRHQQDLIVVHRSFAEATGTLMERLGTYAEMYIQQGGELQSTTAELALASEEMAVSRETCTVLRGVISGFVERQQSAGSPMLGPMVRVPKHALVDLFSLRERVFANELIRTEGAGLHRIDPGHAAIMALDDDDDDLS